MSQPSLELLLQMLESKQSMPDIAPVYKLLIEIAKLEKQGALDFPKIHRKLEQLDKQLDREPSSGAVTKFGDIRTWLRAYQQQLEHSESKARRHFGDDLARLLEPQHIALTGQYPFLQAGLFTIKMRPEQDRVEIWYGREQEKLGETRLLAEEVAKRIEKTTAMLGSRLELDAFLHKCGSAIQRAPRDREDPRRVPIIAVLADIAFLLQNALFYSDPLREHYRSYGRADFSYDLFRCQHDSRVRLVVATRMHTTRRSDYLWVPTDHHGHGASYSHILLEDTTP